MPEVRDNPDQHRYEIVVDGEVAGFAVYHLRGRRAIFVHTEIDPSYEGQGLGGQLVRGALDDVRRRELRVVPLCPFVAGWLDKHEEYRDLVDLEAVRYLEAGA